MGMGRGERGAVRLTPVQARTWRALIEVGEGGSFRPDLADRLRTAIEEGVGEAVPAGARIRLWKERLNDLARCPGLFAAMLAGEAPPFRHTARSAAGTLVHKAVELDVGGRERIGVHTLVELAADRLRADVEFERFWRGLGPPARDELLMEAIRTLESFRASFPPFFAVRRTVAPVCEQWFEVELLSGALTLVGKVDLMLNRPAPDRATRVLVDLKAGRAWAEHAEDMRLYALLHTLRCGVPPYRVATVLLGSGSIQAEVVTEAVLERAVQRVVAGVRAAVAPDPGGLPSVERPDPPGASPDGPPARLTPGPHCARCPRSVRCPASTERGHPARPPPSG
jgi:PD-(D/E)XK nuclease superfamily